LNSPGFRDSFLYLNVILLIQTLRIYITIVQKVYYIRKIVGWLQVVVGSLSCL